MPTFSERLNEALSMREMSPAELAKTTGISEGAISQYRKNAYKASQRNLEKIATALRVSIAWLMGVDAEPAYDLPDNLLPLPQTYKVPLLGDIACGQPITAIEDATELVDVPDYIHADFALRCKGDSMIGARIYDGDIVYIRQQPQVENGEIAAVLIEDSAEYAEATLKRVYLSQGQLVLQAENPLFSPLVFTGDDIRRVRVIGKAVAFTSAIKQ